MIAKGVRLLGRCLIAQGVCTLLCTLGVLIAVRWAVDVSHTVWVGYGIVLGVWFGSYAIVSAQHEQMGRERGASDGD
jgi:hypothetical protein